MQPGKPTALDAKKIQKVPSDATVVKKNKERGHGGRRLQPRGRLASLRGRPEAVRMNMQLSS